MSQEKVRFIDELGEWILILIAGFGLVCYGLISFILPNDLNESLLDELEGK